MIYHLQLVHIYFLQGYLTSWCTDFWCYLRLPFVVAWKLQCLQVYFMHWLLVFSGTSLSNCFIAACLQEYLTSSWVFSGVLQVIHLQLLHIYNMYKEIRLLHALTFGVLYDFPFNVLYSCNDCKGILHLHDLPSGVLQIIHLQLFLICNIYKEIGLLHAFIFYVL